MQKIKFQTHSKAEMLDITSLLQENLELEHGVLSIFCPHTTAGLTINEAADPDVKEDILMKLAKIVTDDPDFQHAEGNSAAHIKASLMGSSLQVVVQDAKLQLGTWQGIYFCEFDGPREREIWLFY